VSQQGDRRAYLVVVIAAITAVGTQLRLQQSQRKSHCGQVRDKRGRFNSAWGAHGGH